MVMQVAAAAAVVVVVVVSLSLFSLLKAHSLGLNVVDDESLLF